MPKLIDADKAYEIAKNSGRYNDFAKSLADLTSLREVLDDCPTVEAVEVVHGRWEKHGKHDWRCSVCKVGVPYSYTGNKYCHNCGAKMDGGDDE